MIISNLIGGLGNQMFQYAAGRALSLQRKQPLLLDVSGFANYELHHGFELQRVFACPIVIASTKDVQKVLGWQANPLIKRRLTNPRWTLLRGNNFVVESHFQYWAGIQQVPPSVYLQGYWQSEKYFQELAAIVRADFTFKLPLNLKNAEFSQKISQVNAVSLHIRRGDYVQNPVTLATHGLCTLAYYQAAIQAIADSVAEPYFFIFSDDMAWVKANLKISLPCQYIDHNQGMESYNDMRLMSLCQHHIIANSSFSWWGAWLNPSINKIVIAPKQWFADDKNTSDLLPQSWLTL
ncbi:MAG: alpha-1,2-fucosyltransferase [Methylococcaceae bacterium]|nr:alpha-1,2-fucosyltransferase [Methylococcaceae bacterium]